MVIMENSLYKIKYKFSVIFYARPASHENLNKPSIFNNRPHYISDWWEDGAPWEVIIDLPIQSNLFKFPIEALAYFVNSFGKERSKTFDGVGHTYEALKNKDNTVTIEPIRWKLICKFNFPFIWNIYIRLLRGTGESFVPPGPIGYSFTKDLKKLDNVEFYLNPDSHKKSYYKKNDLITRVPYKDVTILYKDVDNDSDYKKLNSLSNEEYDAWFGSTTYEERLPEKRFNL